MSAPAPRGRTSTVPTRHVYDVAIVGGQLSGAIAGCLLARRGYQVLYVEHDGTGPGYVHDGWLLPYGPFVMPALKSLAALEEIATELGITTPLQRALKGSSLQLVAPGHRVDLFADPAKAKAEAARAFGEAGAALLSAIGSVTGAVEASDAFFKEKPELPPEGIFGRMRFNRARGRHRGLNEPSRFDGSTAPLAGLLAGLGNFLHYSDGATELAATRPLGLALAGLTVLPGNREAFREIFLARLKELGGDVLAHDESSVVENIAFDGGSFAGVKLVRSDQIYRAPCLLAATDGGALRRLVPDKKRHRAVTEALDGANTKKILFSVNWVLPESALPRGLGELALVQNEDPELSPMLVQVSAARKSGTPGPEKERVVCAGVFVEATARELGEENLQSIAARLSTQLEALLPFARSKVLLESAPYLNAGGVRGSRLLPHPLLSFEDAPMLGVTGLPPRVPAKHMFLCNREVLPGLGVEGEVMTAQRVASLVQQTLKKNDPLKRR